MKHRMRPFIYATAIVAIASTMIISCSKNSSNEGTNASNATRLQVSLTDSPDPGVKAVYVEIKEVRLNMSDSDTGWITLAGAHPGTYNLLALTNGKDTLLADAHIPAGTISQIRLILGDNNYVITQDSQKVFLQTPSAQQSGLKVQVHQNVTGGLLYRLKLDFDAGKSVHKAGNSGKYMLKPVLRVISFVPSGGDIKGVVMPDSIKTLVAAIRGTNDTVATTYTAKPGGGYFFKDVPAGSYTLSFSPSDTSFKKATKPATVTLGQVTVVDTVRLHK